MQRPPEGFLIEPEVTVYIMDAMHDLMAVRDSTPNAVPFYVGSSGMTMGQEHCGAILDSTRLLPSQVTQICNESYARLADRTGLDESLQTLASQAIGYTSFLNCFFEHQLKSKGLEQQSVITPRLALAVSGIALQRFVAAPSPSQTLEAMLQAQLHVIDASNLAAKELVATRIIPPPTAV